MLAPVMEFAFEHNVPQDTLNGIVDTYMAQREDLIAKMSQQDNIDLQQFQQTMKQSENWGKDYQVNMNRAINRLNLLPESMRDQVKEARLPDGKALFNSPEFMTWLVGMDREIMPLDPIPGGGEHDMKSVQSVIDKVEKIFAEGKEGEEYWGQKNLPLRQEYERALAARAQLEKSG